MRINEAKNIILNVTKNLSSTLKIGTGQLLSGQVVSVKGKDILLKIGPHLIEAKAQAYVKEGQNLRLLVDGIKPHEIRLKIVNEDSSILKPEQSILKAMGLKSNKGLEDIVSQLTKFRLPLNKETLLDFSKLQENLQSFLEKSDLDINAGKLVKLAVWLKTLNTEGDGESLLKLHKFFKGQLDPDEEATFFRFLNTRETQVLGNYNVYGWPILDNHIYLLTQKNLKEKITSEGCFLVLKITSKFAGDLWFKADYKSNALKVSISCSSEEAMDIVNDEVEMLYLALTGAGYPHVKILTKVETIDTVLDFIPGSNPEGISYVNIQV